MVTRIGTKQRKTRHKLTQHYRNKGKVPLSKYFCVYNEGDIVDLKINPGIQKGRFFPRFHGKTGRVTGQKGSCYQVTIKDGNKEKRLFVHPIHLTKQK
jgi:large subunit ribosomal protein L21e